MHIYPIDAARASSCMAHAFFLIYFIFIFSLLFLFGLLYFPVDFATVFFSPKASSMQNS